MAQTYEVDRNRVYFDRAPMPYADARSFVDLGYGYAKDRENVYLDGQVLEFVDPATFRLKGADKSQSHEHRDWQGHGRNHKGYHKTKFNVYYGDKKIDAMAASFKEMEGGYAKDAFNVFFYGKKLEGASAASFKILEGGYSKDAFNVYYYGKKVEGAMEIEPTESCGEAEMIFHFDATGLQGTEVVVFERLYEFVDGGDEGDPVIVHENINDLAQSVIIYLPTPNTGESTAEGGSVKGTKFIVAPALAVLGIGGYVAYRVIAKKRFLNKM